MSRTPGVVTLKVEGRVVGSWVQVLKHECERETKGGRAVRLDFTEVSMIDCDGVAMLHAVTLSRVEIVNASPFIRALLAEEEECR